MKKSLKWGIDKIKRTKAILKEHGLINIVQRRKDGKIEGWYIEVAYLVTQRNLEDVKIKVEDSNNTLNPPLELSTIPKSNNTYNQQVDNPTSGEEEINALKEVIKSLKKEIEMLKKDDIDTSNIKISDRAHIVFPYHKELDALAEEARGDNKIGTTKKGIGPCYMDKTERSGIRICDLMDKDVFAKKNSRASHHPATFCFSFLKATCSRHRFNNK